MAKNTEQDGAVVDIAGQSNREQGAGKGPRMWPAVLIVAAHFTALWFSLQAPTAMLSAIGLIIAPLLALVLLSIWWLTARRVPLRERVGGFVLFSAAVAWIVFTQASNGTRLLMIGAPALTTGVVVLLVLTRGMRWPLRRWLVVAFIVGCAGFFTALRVDDVRGNLSPVLSWRWNPSPEELFLALTKEPARPVEPAILPPKAGLQDWPGFRGAARDSRLAGTTFSTNWTETPPRELWRRRVGLGWSSFAAIGEYVFTQEQRGGDEVVVCYRAGTGDEVWVNRVAARFEEATGTGPRATPTFRQGKLYTLGAMGILQCLDAATGGTVWKRDLITDTDAEVPTWGFASSPLVTGELVIVFSGGRQGKSVAAYHCESGDLVWTAGDGTHGYASGHLARIAGVPQVLMCSDIGIQSFTPETGGLLWEHRWQAMTNPRCVQPLVAGAGSVMIGTAGGQGTRLLHVDKKESAWNVVEKWTTRRFRPYFNDFVYYEGYCYGFDGSRLSCIDAKTGERQWKGGRYGGQLLFIADMGTLLVLSENGDVILVQATPEGYHELARFKALDGKTWNHPVVAHGKLFVRNAQEAACFELPMEKASSTGT